MTTHFRSATLHVGGQDLMMKQNEIVWIPGTDAVDPRKRISSVVQRGFVGRRQVDDGLLKEKTRRCKSIFCVKMGK